MWLVFGLLGGGFGGLEGSLAVWEDLIFVLVCDMREKGGCRRK